MDVQALNLVIQNMLLNTVIHQNIQNTSADIQLTGGEFCALLFFILAVIGGVMTILWYFWD